MTLQNNRIAAGWNVPLLSMPNIETIIPTNDRAFYPPTAYGHYSPGQQRIRMDGLVYMAGYPSLVWLFDVLTRLQQEYLRTTYCAGGFSGKVTIYTPLGTSTYVRMNAVMILPSPNATDGKFYAFKAYPVQMTRLAAAA